MRGADAAHGERPPRLHGDLPEIDAARLLEHGLDEVVIANRDAAGGEHDVGVLGRSQQARVELAELVGHDAVVHHRGARVLDETTEREAVRVVDLSRLADASGLGHFVPRGEDGDARSLAHEELGQWATKSEPSHLNVNEMTERLNAGRERA